MVSGTVQGVGFRPFIHRLAMRHGITGSVANTAAGVLIIADGPAPAVQRFRQAISEEAPPLAVIAGLTEKKTCIPATGRHAAFRILDSIPTGETIGPVTPDADVCSACLRELFDPADRRYLYPFINCTDCGPRYTLIAQTPYDRPTTAMADFPMCAACLTEYQDPADRRFHAQATCCSICGPQLTLTDAGGVRQETDAPLLAVAELLHAGNIVAIKGLGGFHLAVDATNATAVARLRARKGRPAKPFAIMAPDAAMVETFARITTDERPWLTDSRKPVILLVKKTPFPLAEDVAPANRLIGVMLPYTPLHHLLFAHGSFQALVMTSGNLSGSPIVKGNDEALAALAGIADFFLLHNRRIISRTDDSVLRLAADGQVTFLRRARSFVPTGLPLATDAGRTLALGAMQKNTVCLTRGDQAFVSQHIGDLDNPETIRQQEVLNNHLMALLRVEPDLIVHDLHPDYPSSRYARHLQNKDRATVAVQHHHAHAVACMAEHGLTGPVLAVILDGTGYGPDRTVWGGEVLVAEHATYYRAAHFTPVPMPGGEAAIREPWRMAISHLAAAFGPAFRDLPLPVLAEHQEQITILTQMMARGINSPLTSSCGRLFDAVAALLDLRYSVSYEGQAAAELEMLILPDTPDPGHYDFAIEYPADRPWLLEGAPLIRAVVEDIVAQAPAPVVSHRFHNALAALFAETCQRLREKTGLTQVVLSGGVFQNMTLLASLTEKLTADGFAVYAHHLVPPNDGGLALGQAVAGRAIFRQRHAPQPASATCGSIREDLFHELA